MVKFVAVLRCAVAVLLTWVAGGGATPASAQSCLCGTLADEFRAADAGLVREWVVQVPFDSAAWRLERVVVGDGLVVAQSGDGGLHAIRTSGTAGPPAGTVAWSRSVGAATGQAWPPTIGSRLVVEASELAIHAFNRETGAVEWERPTDSLTSGAAVQSGDWVYAPLQTSRVLRLPVHPLGRADAEPVAVEPAAEPSATGRRGAQPAEPPSPPESLEPLSIDTGGRVGTAPVPLENGVMWSTDLGLVAFERTPLGWVRHAIPESTPPTWVRRPAFELAGPMVVRGRGIFLASPAGGAARIDLNAPGKPGLRTVWATALSDLATSGPLVADDTVVIAVGPSGIVSLSATDGRERWRSDLVGTLVAAVGGRAWLLDEVGRLTALDLATGSRRQSFCVGCLTVPVVDTSAERLLLASPGGLVVSLRAPVAPATPAPAVPPVTAADAPPDAPGPEDPDATPP